MAQGGVEADGLSTAALRRMMVDGQIRTFDVTDQRVLETFYRTPRELSLPAGLRGLAYSDASLVVPFGAAAGGRAMLQPMFLAKLMQGATLQATHRVLVVAGASGYTAAVVAPLVASVVSLETDAALTRSAADYLATLGLGNATAVTGPLEAGHPEGAPYDCIVVAGGVEVGLERLFAQLAPGGCLVTVHGKATEPERRAGKAVRYDRVADDVSPRNLFDATVPVLDAFREPPGFRF